MAARAAGRSIHHQPRSEVQPTRRRRHSHRHRHPPHPRMGRILSRAYMRGVAIMPWPRYLELHQGRVDVGHFDISDIAYSTAQLIYSRLKRILDLAVVVLTAPLWIPLLGLIALIVWER